jgi:hypothetical protein
MTYTDLKILLPVFPSMLTFFYKSFRLFKLNLMCVILRIRYRGTREWGDTSKKRTERRGKSGNVGSRIEDTMQNKQEEGKTANW